jgi:hypothetical protein
LALTRPSISNGIVFLPWFYTEWVTSFAEKLTGESQAHCRRENARLVRLVLRRLASASVRTAIRTIAAILSRTSIYSENSWNSETSDAKRLESEINAGAAKRRIVTRLHALRYYKMQRFLKSCSSATSKKI